MLKFPDPSEKILPNEIQLHETPHYHHKDEICDRIVGSLIGLSVCDALGASVEFRPRQYLVDNPVQKMQSGGTWGLDAGQWTDDTSMALCLASSLISSNAFNLYDQMVRYKWWFKYGYLSSTGTCFDIGKATRQSLIDFANQQKILKIRYRCRNESEVDRLTWDSVERIKDFQINCGNKESAGNGALMRLAPVPLFYYNRPDLAIEYSAISAEITHANKKAIDACRYYAALIVGALQGLTKDELLHRDFYVKYRTWFGEIPLDEEILSVAQGSFKRNNGYDDGIRGKGYVVNALEAALWAFWSDNDSFRTGALNAVNLGDDTDTTAAIYGQLAGAYYGYKNIPKEWRDTLYAKDLIICIGQWLHFQGKSYQLDNPTFEQTDEQQNVQENNNTRQSHEKISVRFDQSKPTINRSVSLDSSNTRLHPPKDKSTTLFNSISKIDEDFSPATCDYPFYRDHLSDTDD